MNSIKDKKYLNIGYIGSYLKYKGVQDLIIATNNLKKKAIRYDYILQAII